MNNWIKNKEHKPSEFMQVLFSHGNKYVDAGFRDDKGLWQAFSGGFGMIDGCYQVKCVAILDGHVQYWMPLPEFNNMENSASAEILDNFQKKLDRIFASRDFRDE